MLHCKDKDLGWTAQKHVYTSESEGDSTQEKYDNEIELVKQAMACTSNQYSKSRYTELVVSDCELEERLPSNQVPKKRSRPNKDSNAQEGENSNETIAHYSDTSSGNDSPKKKKKQK